jgi:diguanylate cyclase (GGDEF)-like protein/PAS domain S-box-containing protein
MSDEKGAVFSDNQEEIESLLEILRKTGQQIEQLTAGQVDTALDAQGRVLLLRGTSEQLQRAESARQASILNALPANIALLAPDGTIVSVNDGWRLFASANMMQGGPENWIGVNYLEVCDKAEGAGATEAHRVASGIRSVLDKSRQSFALDYDCSTPAEERWAHVSVTPLSTEAASGAIVMHRDISSIMRDRSDLASLAERFSLATEVAKVGVWEWDLGTNSLVWDATMFAIYGLPQAVAMSYETWAATVYPEDLPEVERRLQKAITSRSEESAEFRIIAADGTTRHISATEKAVVDPTGCVCRVVGVNVDVTSRKMAEDELRSNQLEMVHLAEHDPLTDLPNQRVLRDRMGQALKMASRNQTKVGLLFLDLDGFKHINDSLGHTIGDGLLQSVAARLQECVRNSDTVSRFGGDEFVTLLPNVHHPDGSARIAARMLDAVGAMHSVGHHELHVSACIGISVYPDDGLDGETLIKNADSAMYQAKANGGSNYQFFHADMNSRALERQFIEQNLRRALERKELSLHYQPKFDMRTRAITGVEALLRWSHPDRGAISPGLFIPVAEACGLILPIGIWVLEEACRQAREWSDGGLPAISVAVNVSGRQFQSEHFQETVLQVLERTGLDPKFLELEVTESLLMKSPDLAATLLQSLRRMGITVAIDDFGTGFSSLSYLQRFQIDSLKIDQSFVRTIDTPDGVKIVNTIMNLARGLGMQIVAEGVETDAEAAILEQMGCEVAQGYHFGRPLPPAALRVLLERQLEAVAHPRLTGPDRDLAAHI